MSFTVVLDNGYVLPIISILGVTKVENYEQFVGEKDRYSK